MPASTSSFVRRAVSVFLALALLALVGLPACGRSNLDDYLLLDGGKLGDGSADARDAPGDVVGPDNAACNATTCPTGCCDATGLCQAGTSITQCGALGEACQSCKAKGFQLCDPTSHACGNPVAVCDPATCNGCCEGNECLAGTDPNECGLNGQACLHCESSNLACSPQQTCVQPPCGPQTCSGCCFGDECLSGTDPAACGIQGAVCGNCLATGGKCVGEGLGGVCEGASTCSPANCQGCCAGNTCVPGDSPSQCGFGGQQCGNCQGMGGECLPTGGPGGVCEMQGGCGAETCPGCCLGTSCLPGTDPNECGIDGQVCENCASLGGACVSEGGFGGFCEDNTFCGPQNCQGCCEGNACLPGFDPTACGSFGEVCSDCLEFGESCGGFDAGFGQQCTFEQTCSAQNCPGCCAGNTCLQGNDPAACGTNGQLCADCTSKDQTCLGGSDAGFGGGSCGTAPPPVCDAKTCPTGCCDGTLCLPGNLDSFCGTGGGICTNCGAAKKTCTAQACVGAAPTCDATNCQGCCDQNNACQPGFIDTECGESGASCQDCTQIVPASTCDVSVTPRLCTDEQVQCPAPYASCPAGLETPSPTQQSVCSQSDLQNAQAACEGGAHSTACVSFFAFEKSQNPSCASCLTPFDYDFSELTGLTTCAAPFTDPTCNHITACLVDCTDKACAQCVDPGALADCQEGVPNTVCASYYNDAQCIDDAFFGPGSFCDPDEGTGQFGDWLLPVGQYYCGGGLMGVDAGFPGGGGSSSSSSGGGG
ncbi:MAG TPA: hypothetical protein VGL81_09715 [Polyangiaceae bacterium]